EVVLLVAAGVLGEDDALVVTAPGEARAERRGHLAVAHLPHLLGREVHHVELYAACLVPIEGDPIALPGHRRKEERRKAAELLERDTRLTARFNSHARPPQATATRSGA